MFPILLLCMFVIHVLRGVSNYGLRINIIFVMSKIHEILCNAEEFKSFFEKFGKIAECQIMQDHSTGRSRGFGFVTYDSEESVENALTQGRMHELDGKQVIS